jgi:flagellar biosynthesis/type III secretory pathway chaperone
MTTVATHLVADLASALDEGIAIHERLIELTNGQRRAVAAGQVEVVEMIAGEMENAALRLSGVEETRQRAAMEIADAAGIAATRWSALRDAINPVDVLALDARVARLETLVRDLELANAINGELIRREMELMDYSIRGMMTATQGPSANRYTSGGQMAAPQGASPVLLNTTA